MHDGGAMTFQFSNPAGRSAQQQDREGVKELLQQLLPKFRKKVDSELEEKNKLVCSTLFTLSLKNRETNFISSPLNLNCI